MMKMKMKIKIGVIVILGASLWCSIATNKKYNNISKKLDMIMSNQEMIWLNANELKIDSLQQEVMYLGSKLDSMQLKYDFGYEF